MSMHTSQVFDVARDFPVRGGRRRRHLAERIWNFLRRAANAWRKRAAHRRAVSELSQLDDRMLRDMGIERSQIASVVRHGRWDWDQNPAAEREDIWR